jgi:hypothetical protein
MTIPWTIGQFFESVGPQSLFEVMGLLLVTALGLFAALNAVKTPPRGQATTSGRPGCGGAASGV